MSHEPARTAPGRIGDPITEHASSWRIVVSTLDPEPAGWDLPAAEPHERTDIAGGIRTLHELAVAAAVSGREVELRGPMSSTVLDALAEAAGARPVLPVSDRRPTAGDIVVVPNGGYDLTRWARSVLSPARLVLALLSPTGQSGWPFVSPWYPQPHLSIPLDSVCRPEHFRAMAALSIDLWTNMRPVTELARAEGARCMFIGNGEPAPPPLAPVAKEVPVVYLEANRWRPLAEGVSRKLQTPAEMIPAGDHATVMDALARAHVLIWPARVEGDGRLLREARIRGTVVVGLSSNVYATGLDEAGGAIAVDSLEQMPEAVEALLGDPGRLQALAETGRRSAREQVDWGSYVERVDAAITATERRAEDPAASARGAFGERLATMLGERVQAIDRVRELDRHLAEAHARVECLDRELDAASERIVELELHMREAAKPVARTPPSHMRSTSMIGELARRTRRRLRRRQTG